MKNEKKVKEVKKAVAQEKIRELDEKESKEVVGGADAYSRRGGETIVRSPTRRR